MGKVGKKQKEAKKVKTALVEAYLHISTKRARCIAAQGSADTWSVRQVLRVLLLGYRRDETQIADMIFLVIGRCVNVHL